MDIRDAALRYLEHRMRTMKEMKKKLREKGFGEDEISETTEWLLQSGYINDVDYGSEYIRYGFEKGRSINRIKIELKEKGLSSEDIEKAVYAYEDEYEIDIIKEEYERALSQGRKIAISNGTDEKALAKMGRRLSSLGYQSSIIYKVIGFYRESGQDSGIFEEDQEDS